MKYNFIAIVMLLLLTLALVACDNDNGYIKDPTASLKSDSEDYFVPNIYIDIEDNEGNNLGGNEYGEYKPIE